MFDFDTIVDRAGTDALKWETGATLPMWVADMDFETAPAVREAIEHRARHGAYGYTVVPDSWYDAYIGWWRTRHDLTIEKDQLCFSTGVIPALTSIVKRITNVGDSVVIPTPVYDIFFHSVENTGRHVLENPLRYKNGKYTLDFADLETKLATETATAMLLCNPQNPTGNIWAKDELKEIGRLCKKYGVTVVADEIHCDLTDPDYAYTPFFSVDGTCREIGITLLSASKAFNIAGLQSAAVCVANARLRRAVVRGLNSDEVAEPNCFAAVATIAALKEGGAWLDALRAYLAENKRAVKAFLEKELPQVRLVDSHATYLLWLDCAAVTDDTTELAEHILQATGLRVSAGGQYRGNGAAFLRLNVATQRARLSDGLARLQTGVVGFRKQSAR